MQFKIAPLEPLKSLKQDILFGKEYVEQVCNLIKVLRPPFTLGIAGEWGSGKTTLFNFIHEKLESEFAIVKFESWKFQRTSNLVPLLLKEIERELKLQDIKRWKLVADRALEVFEIINPRINIGPVSFTFNVTAWRARNVKKRYKDLAALKQQFIAAVDEALQKVKRETLLILVDDLDRCLPEITLEFLENIKNFLCTPKTVFVIALDERVIDTALKTRYGTQTIVDSTNYLEKVIDFFIRLPQYDAKRLSDFLYRIVSETGAYREDFDSKLAIKKALGIRSLMRSKIATNPRKIGRVITNATIYTQTKKQAYLQFFPLIFILFIIKEYFPLLYWLIRNIDGYIVVNLAGKGETDIAIDNTIYAVSGVDEKFLARYGEQARAIYGNEEAQILSQALVETYKADIHSIHSVFRNPEFPDVIQRIAQEIEIFK